MTIRMTSLAIGLTLGFAVAGPAPARADEVDILLAKIDAALFFYDAQEKLQGYDAELATLQAMPASGKPANAKAEKATNAGRVSVDAAKGTREVAPAGCFVPACGPWTLTTLCAFEIDSSRGRGGSSSSPTNGTASERRAATLKITPSLTFSFDDKDKSGIALPQAIEFRVPGAQLSGTIRGSDMVTSLFFRSRKIKKAK